MTHVYNILGAISELAPKLTYKLNSMDQAPYQTFVKALTQVTVFTQPSALEELATHADYYAKKVTNKESHVSRLSFTKWLKQSLLKGAGPAHKASKQDTQVPSPNVNFQTKDRMVSDPNEAMDHRAAEWGQIWIAQDSEWPLIVHLLEQAYDVALTQHSQPPTYTPADIKRIIRCTNIHKGYGADGVTAGFLKYLPEEGYTQIYYLFVQMDTCVMPPFPNAFYHYRVNR